MGLAEEDGKIAEGVMEGVVPPDRKLVSPPVLLLLASGLLLWVWVWVKFSVGARPYALPLLPPLSLLGHAALPVVRKLLPPPGARGFLLCPPPPPNGELLLVPVMLGRL